MSNARELGVFVVGLVVVAVVLNAFFGAAAQVGEPENAAEDVLLGENGQGALSYSGPVSDLAAQQSLGTALHFTGADDSEVRGGELPNVDRNWTVTTWGRLDETASSSSERRLLQLDDWLYVDYNDTNWRVTYYDAADMTVHQVSVNAPDPYNMTHLGIRANETTLQVYRNKTLVANESLASGGASIPNASNWYGTAEETRISDEYWSRSTINKTNDEPTAPTPNADESARVMYDLRPGESAVDVFWTGSDLTRMNTTIVAGFEGQPTEEKTLLGGDYTFDDDSDTISAVDGGTLDGAPVVYVTYTEEIAGTLGGVVEGAGQTAGTALSLLAVGAIIIAARELLEF